jgi:hypothetical protein
MMEEGVGMNTLGVVFLGIIAVCALIHVTLVSAAVMAGRKAAARLDALVARVEGEWPRLELQLTDTTKRLGEAAQRAEAAATSVERVVDKVTSATGLAASVALAAAGVPRHPVRTGMALWNAVRRAVAVYKQPRFPSA